MSKKKQLMIELEYFEKMLSTGNKLEVLEGLPPGSRIFSIRMSNDRDRVIITWEHPDNYDQPMGAPYEWTSFQTIVIATDG